MTNIHLNLLALRSLLMRGVYHFGCGLMEYWTLLKDTYLTSGMKGKNPYSHRNKYCPTEQYI